MIIGVITAALIFINRLGTWRDDLLALRVNSRSCTYISVTGDITKLDGHEVSCIFVVVFLGARDNFGRCGPAFTKCSLN